MNRAIIRKYNLYSIFFIILIISFWIGFLLNAYVLMPPEEKFKNVVQIPSFLGKNLSEVKNLIEERKLKIDIFYDSLSICSPESMIVIDQDPKPEVFINKYSKVNLFLKEIKNNQENEIYLGAYDLKEAIEKSKEKKILVTNIDYFKSIYPKNVILSDLLNKFSNNSYRNVDLLVSAGENTDEIYYMPDLRGYNYDEIRFQLRKSGFNVNIDSLKIFKNKYLPDNIILEQFPQANSVIKKDSVIYFYINRSQ